MKYVFYSVCTLCIAVLVGWGMYLWNDHETSKLQVQVYKNNADALQSIVKSAEQRQ